MDADLCLLLLSYNTSVLYKIVISIIMDMTDSHANKYIMLETTKGLQVRLDESWATPCSEKQQQ